MDLCIRPAVPDDAEALVAILNPIIQAGTYTVLDEPLTVEYERQYVVDFPPRGIFLVAERRGDGKVVGLQSLEPFATYTHAFDHVAVAGTFVDMSHLRLGIGTELSRATFGAGRRAGYLKIFTYIRADNPTSLAFYLKLGFRIVGTAQRHARIGGRYVDEIIVEMFL